MEKVGAYTDRATEVGEWRAGNPGLGQQATPMLAAYFNMQQRELVGVVEAADIELDAEDDGQLLQAINALIDLRVPDKLFLSLNVDTVLTSAQMGLLTLDASGGNRVFTLPAADAGLGVVDVIVRRVDNSGNRLKVQAAGADKIKFHTHLSATGYPFLVLMGAGDWWHLRSDGEGGWWPIARRDDSPLGRLSFETSTAIQPGGYGLPHGVLFVRADWPWVWDHAQASGMLVDDANRAGFEGCWTRGDGATTVRSPDVRAEFLRALDEGRGKDAARTAGSWQKGSMHSFDTGASIGMPTDRSGAASSAAGLVDIGYDSVSASVYPNGQSVSVGGGTVTSVAITTEIAFGATRPSNIAYPARIKLI